MNAAIEMQLAARKHSIYHEFLKTIHDVIRYGILNGIRMVSFFY